MRTVIYTIIGIALMATWAKYANERLQAEIYYNHQ